MTSLSETHFTACRLPAPVPPVRVGRQEVDTSVLNGFPNSQRFRSRALFAGRRVGGLAVLVGSVPEKRVFLWVVPHFGFQFGVDLSRALGVRGEPMVPFVLVRGIQVVASCGHAEECPCWWGWGAHVALDPNRRFLIPKVGQPSVIGMREMKSSNPSIPTTARASSGPFMDILSRRR